MVKIDQRLNFRFKVDHRLHTESLLKTIGEIRGAAETSVKRGL